VFGKERLKVDARVWRMVKGTVARLVERWESKRVLQREPMKAQI